MIYLVVMLKKTNLYKSSDSIIDLNTIYDFFKKIIL